MSLKKMRETEDDMTFASSVVARALPPEQVDEKHFSLGT